MLHNPQYLCSNFHLLADKSEICKRWVNIKEWLSPCFMDSHSLLYALLYALLKHFTNVLYTLDLISILLVLHTTAPQSLTDLCEQNTIFHQKITLDLSEISLASPRSKNGSMNLKKLILQIRVWIIIFLNSAIKKSPWITTKCNLFGKQWIVIILLFLITLSIITPMGERVPIPCQALSLQVFFSSTLSYFTFTTNQELGPIISIFADKVTQLGNGRVYLNIALLKSRLLHSKGNHL